MFKKITAITCLTAILCSPWGQLSAKAEGAAQPDIYGKYGVAIDASTGEVLYGKNENEQSYPASITKVMTSILLLEHSQKGEMITASKNAVNQEASNAIFKLSEGEKISREQALKAMMVISANDVATAAGEHVGKTAEDFGKMMTKKAKELGAKNTNFITPSGLHDENHKTTPYDMALIGREAMKYPELLHDMSLKTSPIQTSKQKIEYTNPARIMEIPNAVGGKTGYTDQAQNTLLVLLQKDHKEVVSVVMASSLQEEYKDIEKMANYAFDQLDAKQVVKKGEKVSVYKRGDQEINAIVTEDAYVTLKKKDNPKLQNKVEFEKDLPYRIEKGQEIGKLKVMNQDKLLKEVPVVAEKSVIMTKQVEKETTGDRSSTLVIQILGAITLIFVGWTAIRRKKQKTN